MITKLGSGLQDPGEEEFTGAEEEEGGEGDELAGEVEGEDAKGGKQAAHEHHGDDEREGPLAGFKSGKGPAEA